MKKLLSTAAVITALAAAIPASAQRTGPGPTASTGTGPGVIPPGGCGPSSPLHNLNAGSGLFGAAPSMKVEGSAAPVAPGTESFQLLRQ